MESPFPSISRKRLPKGHISKRVSIAYVLQIKQLSKRCRGPRLGDNMAEDVLMQKREAATAIKLSSRAAAASVVPSQGVFSASPVSSCCNMTSNLLKLGRKKEETILLRNGFCNSRGKYLVTA